MKKELKTIYRIQKDISVLSSVLGLLSWDQKTYMPKDANSGRAEEITAISKLIHEKFLSNELYKAVKKLNSKKIFKTLNKKDKLVVKKLYKAVMDARKIPSEFVEEMSLVTSNAVMKWQEAKEKNNFKIFSPWLEKTIKLKRKQCEYVKIPGHPYNSLLDDFEEGMTVEKLRPIFQKLKIELIDLLNEIKKTKKYKRQKSKIKGKFPIPKQEKLSKEVMNRMCLPDSKTRLDVSAHPFTLGLSLKDVRITTSYDEKSPFSAFIPTIHEAGHCLYQLGLPEKFKHTLIGGPASIGLHESQSKFWEYMVARNSWFWEFYSPIFKKTFKKELKNLHLRDLYEELNQVKASKIRVYADEVTYCLHIILRFELELKLIEGKLKVKDLPKAWNKKTKEFLGITPKNDKEGVLQDVHWGMGVFGYFPTYAIGTIYAAQLFNKLLKEKHTTKEQIKKGNFKLMLNWLRKNIHELGSSLTSEEIIQKVCKESLNPDEYVKYLRNKYLGIYKK